MSKKIILIIDDEVDFVEMFRLRLVSAGYDVIMAFDGVEGLEKAKAEKPDLIILDIVLPKMDGNKVGRILKADAELKKIPIIILTARVNKKEERSAFEAGVECYMSKPCESPVLLDKIKELLNK